MQTSITLEEVENASSLAQKLEKLELPNQLVAVLADPVLQKLLLLRPSDEAYQRISNWLHSVLQDVIAGSADDNTLWEVLDVVRDFVTQTKVRSPRPQPAPRRALTVVSDTAPSSTELLCRIFRALERGR